MLVLFGTKYSRMDQVKSVEDNHKLCNEMGHQILNLMDSQRKLRQQHNQNFPMEGKSL